MSDWSVKAILMKDFPGIKKAKLKILKQEWDFDHKDSYGLVNKLGLYAIKILEENA